MAINPFTGLEEEGIDPLTGMPVQKSFTPDMLMVGGAGGTPRQPAPPPAARAPAVIEEPSLEQEFDAKPDVNEYIAKKFSLGKYSPEARQKLSAENEPGFGDKAQAALAAIGAGFMGKDAAAAGQGVLARQKGERDSKLAEFDKNRANAIQDYSLNREIGANDREDDPESAESKMADELARRMGYKGAPITATKFKSFSPALQKMYEIEEKKLDRRDAREERRALAGMKLDDKITEREAKLGTPYGLANSEDDAKKLKEAHESKKNFDKKLKEMIALREKHGGGALLNRDDVGRGKQLSKDLLLEYKNMAKLGVLSAADENIINEIIPADPLQYNSPLAAAQGQDPTLHKLKKFMEDSDADFSTRVSTRTRGGKPSPVGSSEKTIVKTQTNKRTGEKRIVYSDGSTEIVAGSVARK